ncbi:MAG: 50S ribosome-binding GTPase, partial [Deltaproteobacteria bacterium]|nr:50S ribosome-binding GTPase [Deltaproteobacteria bacterium]
MTHIALAGNPNSGKTTLFNALTGSHQKIANYGGVTVEKKEGFFVSSKGKKIIILDLPGTYSLNASSPDELIAQEVLLGLRSDVQKPKAVIVVVDADNLERNLYLTLQLKEVGIPIIMALNMMDVAQRHQKTINVDLLSKELGIPVIPMVARSELGLEKLKNFLEEENFESEPSKRKWILSRPLEELCSRLVQKLVEECDTSKVSADYYARELLKKKHSNRFQLE